MTPASDAPEARAPAEEGFPAAARALLAELAALPYENLSKIVAWHRGSAELAQDAAAGWLDAHRRTGHGGTCFALTAWLKARLDAVGIESAYLMADKRIAPNVHCGLLVSHSGREWLLDPGYLIFEPLPLPAEGLSAAFFLAPNAVRIDALPRAWRLHTGPRGALKHRFDFRREPVSEAEFLRHWEASHRWEMMGYPVLNRVRDGVQYYLQKNSLLVRSAESSVQRALGDAEVREAARTLFGLPRALVDEAMGILGRGAVKK